MVDLKPIAPPPERRTGAPPPPGYAEVMGMVKRLEPVLAAVEPGVYRLQDVLAALDADGAAKLSGVPADRGAVVSAARYLGGDALGPVGAPDMLLVHPPAELKRRQFLVETTARRHIVAAQREAGDPGTSELLHPQAVVTVRVLQRRLRGDWVTSWALRGYLHRLVDAGALQPVDPPPVMTWTVR